MREQKKRNPEAGITLLEILVVLTIIGLISGLVIFNVGPILQNARIDQAKTNVKNIEGALENYNLALLSYPTEQQGLEALIEAPTDLLDERRYPVGGFIRELPEDPWGRPYQYVFPAERSRAPFDIFSFGRDGQEGGEGPDADIGNWDEDDE